MNRILSACVALMALVLSVADRSAVAQNGDWGTVKGVVLLNGPMPTPKKIVVDKDPQHCLTKGPIPDETWVVNPNNKGVRWAFVWLQPAESTEPMKIHPKLQALTVKEVVMDQPCCKFEPHALALREGQVLVVKNSAPVAHNVNYQGFRNAGANVLVPAGGTHKIDNLKADKLPISVACNIHGWMKAYIRVYNHPYYTVTDADGKFEIKDAPAGKYRLVSWHEGSGWGPGGRDGMEITIKGGAATEAKLELTPAK